MRNYFISLSRIFFLVYNVLLITSAKGATYYFSSSGGNDSRTASQAKNPSTPWKSLSKLNSIFSHLKPGDSVLFKRGDLFFGSITISESGTASSPIVLAAYGNGNKPVITGLVSVSGWTYIGNGIYESASNDALGNTVNMVLMNGSVKPMGRYPNANAPNGGYITYQSHVGQTSISGNDLRAWPNWTGGEIVIRPIRHVLDRCVITDHSGSKITYKKVSNYIPIDGYGFFIQNHIKTLDQFSEWYYNSKTKKISVYFGSVKPSSYIVQVGAKDALISGQSRTFITFENLMLRGVNNNAFDFLGGDHITIRNCDILYAGIDGIYTHSTNHVKIDNTTVSWCNSDGIFLQASNTDVPSNSVTNCVVKNIGIFAGMGESDGSSYQGITVMGGKNLVQNNTVRNTGYVGIKYMYGDSVMIKNNYVDTYCFIKNDGGGIYTWNNIRDKNGNLNAITYHGSKITGNIILNAGNADAGTIYSETNVDHPQFGSHGIYCDENTQYVEVSGNTVANNGKGIFLHDNRNIIVENNTVFNNRERQMDIYYDDLTVPAVRNITIKNNIFFSKYLDQETGGCRSLYNDIHEFGTYDYNYYAQAFHKNNSISSKYIKSDGLTYYENFNLSAWRSEYSFDSHSKTATSTLKQYKLNGFLSGNMYNNGTYDSKTIGTNGYNPGGTCVSSWVSGKLDGGSYKLSYKGRSTKSTITNIIINIGSVSSTKNYILRYSVLGTKRNGSVGVYLRQGSTPYDQLIPIQFFPVTTSRIDNEVLFSFPATENNAQLVFQLNDRDSTVYLDNVKLFASDVTITNPNDYVRFYYNPTNSKKTIALDAKYLDVRNTVYSGNITLNPYTSIILMRESATSLVSNSLGSNSSISKIDSADNDKTKLKLTAFPNPAPKEFNLLIRNGDSNAGVQIDVFDMSGRNVYHTTGDIYKKYTFGGTFLPGVYILKVTQGQNTQTIKLIK